MKGEVIPSLTPEVTVSPTDVQDTTSTSSGDCPSALLADGGVSDAASDDPLTITKSIKVAPDVEIPIHIPVAQPTEPRVATRGRGRTGRGRPRNAMRSKTGESLRKIMPAPPSPVLIRTVKPVIQPGQSMMESVLNDPAIQELLKQNPGHTLTVVRVPDDAQLSKVQVESLAGAGRLLGNGNRETLQVTLTDRETALPEKTPKKPGRKRKKRKREELDEDSDKVGETEPKVTRSGRVIKRPAYQGKYYVGHRGKSLRGPEPSSEESGAVGEPDNKTTEQDGTITTNAARKPVKKALGRPNKSIGTVTTVDKDPVPRYRINNVAREVTPWVFMLMRVIAKHKNKPLKSFYSELLQEFEALVTSMRHLSGGVLEKVPGSSAPMAQGEEVVDLSEVLASSLGMDQGLYQTEIPTRDLLPERVLGWLGSKASVFPRNEEDTPSELTVVGLPEEETSETRGAVKETAGTAEGAEKSGPTDVVVESLEQAVGALTAEAEGPVTPTTNTVQMTSDPVVGSSQVQGALIPPGSVIMKMDDGTFMAQTPAGANMEIKAPSNMTLEALGALLGQAVGAQGEEMP